MYATIQASRAVAAIVVVMFHLGGTIALDKYFGLAVFSKLFAFGHAGVDFFFVLSGFIITYVHWHDFGKPERLLSYLRKRAVRIYPAYWMVFFLVCVGAYVYPGLRDSVPSDPLLLLKSLALVPQDKLAVGGTGAPVVVVAWSLQYEWLFYALMAIFIVSIRWGFVVVVGVAMVSVYGWKSTEFPVSFIAREWLFLFGMGALVGTVLRQPWRVRKPKMWALLGGFVFLGTAVVDGLWVEGEAAYLSWWYGLGSAMMIFGLVKLEDGGISSQWKKPWVLQLGDASYVLYLIHFPIISLLCKVAVKIGLAGVGGAVATFVVVLLFCVFSAVVFHRAIEKPLLRQLSEKK